METLFWWLAVAGLVMLYVFQSFFTRLFTDKYQGDPSAAPQVLTIVSAAFVISLTFFAFSGCSFTFNGWSILIGAANALCLYGYNYFMTKANRLGPYSIVMIFSLSGGIIIPIVVSLIMGWDKSWSTPANAIINLLSIATIIFSVYLVSDKKEEAPTTDTAAKKGSITVAFILACLGIGICNGGYGTFLTLQQQTAAAGGELNRDEMVITTYFFAALISFVIGIVQKKGEFFRAFRQTKQSAIYLVATGIVFALAINLIVIIIPHFDTTILYTVDNASVFIVSVLLSCIVFKEKLSVKNIIGVISMVLALVAMNILPTLVK